MIRSGRKLKYLVKSLKKFKSKSLGGTPSILLTPFNQKRSCQRTLPSHLSRDQSYSNSSPPLLPTNPPPRIAHARSLVYADQETSTQMESRPRMAQIGNGDIGGKGLGRDKGEPAKPRAKRTKEASGKMKGAKAEEAEEAAKEDRVKESIKRIFS